MLKSYPLSINSRLGLLLAAASSWWLLGMSLHAQSSAVEAPEQATASSDTDQAKRPQPKTTIGKQKTEEFAPGTKWVRLEYDAKGKPKALQTAVVRYRPQASKTDAQGLEVDLVGAIHVGDAAYYEALNERFDSYDALLYELVAPEGTRIERGTRASSRHALGAMQNGMKDLLELEHQLELIDYTKPNFIHADMTPEEFFKAMEERKESFLSMYMRLVGQSIAAQSKTPGQRQTSDVDMLAAFFSKDRPRRLKIAMAKQFSDMEQLLTSFGGEEGNTLIHGRNIKAFEVLKREIEAGKQKLGVFYGAGHLADMHQRLVDDFGLEAAEIVWLTAWDLTDGQAGKKNTGKK